MTKYLALLAVAACLAAGWIAAGVQPGQAAAGGAQGFTCSFDEATGAATVTGRGPGLYVALLDDEIQLRWYPTPKANASYIDCTRAADPSVKITPTLSNTDSLMLDVQSEVSSSLWVRGAPSPGKTPEPETSEVETYVGPDVSQLTISLESPRDQEIELGSLGQAAGIDLDVSDEASGSADADVIFTEPFSSPQVTPVQIIASYRTGDMGVSGAGGRAFDGAFPAGVRTETGSGDDRLTAGVGPVYFNSGAGTNVVTGSDFDDHLTSNGPATMTGRAGDDWLAVGFGRNSVDGGPGTDGAGFILWRPPGDSDRGVDVRFGVSGPQDVGFGMLTELTAIERLVGSHYNDRLTGSAGADLLEGWRGYDRIAGRDGDDVLLGGDGHDRIMGGRGSDLLRGNRDLDVLHARDGVRDKRLSCGPGAGDGERAGVDSKDPAPRSC